MSLDTSFHSNLYIFFGRNSNLYLFLRNYNHVVDLVSSPIGTRLKGLGDCVLAEDGSMTL